MLSTTAFSGEGLLSFFLAAAALGANTGVFLVLPVFLSLPRTYKYSSRNLWVYKEGVNFTPSYITSSML